jgi:hypothetical protein
MYIFNPFETGLLKGEVCVKWLELVGIIEALVIRIGGLILISIFIGKAILHELAR